MQLAARPDGPDGSKDSKPSDPVYIYLGNKIVLCGFSRLLSQCAAGCLFSLATLQTIVANVEYMRCCLATRRAILGATMCPTRTRLHTHRALCEVGWVYK